MNNYNLGRCYVGISYKINEANFTEFENCTFTNCNFSKCTFVAVVFIDCTFNGCIFSGAKINYVAFRTAFFNNCEMADINFAMCDRLIFEIHFENCRLDRSKFYALKIKGTTFNNCSIVAVDFMNADLSGAVFDNCDLHKTLFMDSIANKADFTTSYNYTLDPGKNKIKNAIFSLQNVKGLLAKHKILVD